MSVDAWIDTGNKVGRSFNLGTFIPTIGLTAWIALIFYCSGSYGEPASWPNDPLSSITWAKVGAAGLVFLVVSLAIHPLLFATTQLLEGYWGPSFLAILVGSVASRRHRARLHRLNRVMDSSSDRLDELVERAYEVLQSPEVDRTAWTVGWLDDEPQQSLHSLILRRDAAAKARESYPESASRIMPTVLGNTLRREEDRVGAQYGLNALTIAGHLAFLLPKQHGDHLDDARQQLDTAVRLCAAGLVAFALTFLWLSASGWSLLLALGPLGFAYMSYRGSVAAAQEYMFTFGVLLDIHRFSLYTALHIPLPEDAEAEATQNQKMMGLLSGMRSKVPYAHSAATKEDESETK